MQISEKGIEFIKAAEGFERNVYKDVAGLPTIGVGHLLTRSELTSGKIYIKGRPVRYRDGLSDHEVNELLADDLDRFERAVDQAGPCFNQHQFDALVSFTFNLGVSAFQNSTLLKVIKAGGSDQEIARQFRRWVFAGGRKVRGLEIRRENELRLYINGEYA